MEIFSSRISLRRCKNVFLDTSKNIMENLETFIKFKVLKRLFWILQEIQHQSYVLYLKDIRTFSARER